MNFSPYLRPAAWLMLAVTLSACSTPANRRELYNTSYSDSGAWHDYTRRREAEAETGIDAGTAPSALPGRGRPTAAPAVGPAGDNPGTLPPGSTITTTSTSASQEPLSPAVPPPASVPPPADSSTLTTPVDAGGATTPPTDTTTPPPQ